MTKRFQYRSEIQSISAIRNDLAALADTWDIPSPELKQITLIIEELFSYIIRFAFKAESQHPIELEAAMIGQKITLEMSDEGIPFNPLDYDPDLLPDPASAEDGGMGISLIRAFADVLRYERRDQKNYLYIEKNIRTRNEE